MKLFLLTLSAIYQRKAWALCAFAVLALPFLLPLISSATEKPILLQPARAIASWNSLWACALLWGLFTAAWQGESNAKSGVGEYFLTQKLSPTRQLFEIWLAVFSFVAPLALISASICQFAAAPANPAERSMWLITNLQSLSLFLLVIAPLLALAIALASRFGGIVGFSVTLLIALHGLYGVGFLGQMLKLDATPILKSFWEISPHYHLADLSQRLGFKSGALPAGAFWSMAFYFLGICLVYAGLSRLCFRFRSNA